MQKPRTSFEPEQKRKSHIGTFILLFVLILLVLGGLYVWGIVKELNHEELDQDNLGITSSVVIKDNPQDKSITSIALFGVDQRDGETQVRSDAIMILTVDKEHNKIKLSSLMRDTAVEIEGHGQNKLNSAYFYGGPQLAVKTINQNFGTNITEYATVNFQQMASIVDAVGGVEIDVSEKELLDANNSIYEQSNMAGLPQDIIKKAGVQMLSGTQAVAYARIRYVKTDEGQADDFGRTDRQREVLSKMFDRALDLSTLQYPEFARKLLPAVVTSLDFSEIMELSTIMLREVALEQTRFPQTADLIGNGVIYVGSSQCLNVDLVSVTEKLRAFVYDDINPDAPLVVSSDSTSSMAG